MSDKEILKVCLKVVAIYLIIINIVLIAKKIFFPTYISNYIIEPNILMVAIGVAMWLITKRLISSENGSENSKHIEFKIAGLIILTNGFYEFINILWIGITSYVDRPKVMIGTTEMSGSEGIWSVNKLILPHLIIYLAEIIVGFILFVWVKNRLNRGLKIVKSIDGE